MDDVNHKRGLDTPGTDDLNSNIRGPGDTELQRSPKEADSSVVDSTSEVANGAEEISGGDATETELDRLTYGTFRYIKDGDDDDNDSNASFSCGSEDEDGYDRDEEEFSEEDEIDGESTTKFPWMDTGVLEQPRLDDIKEWDLLPLLVHSELANETKELIMRELSFLDQMLALQKFRDHVRREGLIPDAELRSIFPNLDTIIKCHLYLKSDLRNEIGQRPAAPRVGKAFLKIAPFFKIHEPMICASEHSQAILKGLSERERIKQLMQRYMVNRLPLWELLTAPFKYLADMKLIFSSYIGSLDTKSADKKAAQDSQRSIVSVLARINDLKLYYEQVERMVQLRPYFKRKNLEIMKEHRRLLLEDQVKEINPRRGTKPEVEAFLFNDVLILCKPNLNEWICEITIVGLMDTFIEQEGLRIIIHTPRKVVEILPRQPLHAKWMKLLRENCIAPRSDQKNIPGRRAPRLMTAKLAKTCGSCKKNLQSSLRVNHCHCCGKINCADCTERKLCLLYDPERAKKVCKMCYRRLTVRSK